MKRKLLNPLEAQWYLSKEGAFTTMVKQIPQIGMDWHRETLLENSICNAPHIQRTVRALLGQGKRNALVISAGPSLYRNGILRWIKSSNFQGDIIAIDGSYIQCLKAGIVPDYVITLDPHPTRVVRWFGDPDYEKHRQEDDYFERQDLDMLFRQASIEKNQGNIRLVDENPCKLVISTTSPANVVARTSEMDRFWFAPLVDDPSKDGLTRAIIKETGAPAINTGGTVGTAAIIFARSILRCDQIAVVGMDLGYYPDTPLKQTQSYHMLKGNPEMYHWETTPYGRFYTDPTYFWYRQNLLDLLEANNLTLTNCTGAGMLYGKNIVNMELEDWLKSCS